MASLVNSRTLLLGILVFYDTIWSDGTTYAARLVAIPGSHITAESSDIESLTNGAGDEHFTCDLGRKIPGRMKCNGYDDCGDGSDEKNCSSCSGGEPNCRSRELIREAWKCDGFEDAADGSDEKYCGLRSLTKGSQTGNWRGPFTNIWNDDECPNLKNDVKSLSECQAACVEDLNCTAINYNPTSNGCTLRGCPEPVQFPQWHYPPHQGYYVIKSEDHKPCSGFSCANGRCIISSWICDGWDDCGDNSDENNCNTCSSTQFKCASDGKCISENWKCDQYKDCSDNSDEIGCKNQSCRSNQFQCLRSGKCITASWKCDNYKDCEDNSDEVDCKNCTSAEFHCVNKECVSSSSKCNGKDDCGDNSDEENCPSNCQCGIANTAKIVGGTEVHTWRKYPWQVNLQRPGYYAGCGGSIINDRWILTAAHCITDDSTCRIKYDSSSDIVINVGDHNQVTTDDDDDDLNTKKYHVKTWIKHPNYSCKTLEYDFALLELTEAIPFNDVIRPVCLPKDDNNTYIEYKATVSGWGRIATEGYPSDFLQETQLVITANDKCGEWGSVEAMMLCAGGVVGKSTCYGDSGGPLTVVENGVYVQVGVVSYGVEYGCAVDDFPAVFARTSKVLSWIKTTTASGKSCD